MRGQEVYQKEIYLPCDCIDITSFYKYVEHALPVARFNLRTSFLPLRFGSLSFRDIIAIDVSLLIDGYWEANGSLLAYVARRTKPWQGRSERSQR